MRFSQCVFAAGGVWGLLVLSPLYFLFDEIGRKNPPAMAGFRCARSPSPERIFCWESYLWFRSSERSRAQRQWQTRKPIRICGIAPKVAPLFRLR
jgi:hypothetical protein